MATEVDHSVAIKTMKLYSEPGQLVKNEIKHTGEKDPEKIAMLGHLHYNGTDALDAAAKSLFGGEEPSGVLLDVGAGLGSSGRYLALKHPKLRVLAMELQPDLVTDGKEISETCGVGDRVEHTVGDITSGPVANGPFDAAISILVILHIDDKEKVFRNMAASLKPGAKVFIEDFVLQGEFTEEEWGLLKTDVYCSKLTTQEEYGKIMEACGFKNVKIESMTENWQGFVKSRYEAYKDAKERNVEVHGEGPVSRMMRFYSSVNTLFSGGNLGGVRVVAEKAQLVPSINF